MRHLPPGHSPHSDIPLPTLCCNDSVPATVHANTHRPTGYNYYVFIHRKQNSSLSNCVTVIVRTKQDLAFSIIISYVQNGRVNFRPTQSYTQGTTSSRSTVDVLWLLNGSIVGLHEKQMSSWALSLFCHSCVVFILWFTRFCVYTYSELTAAYEWALLLNQF